MEVGVWSLVPVLDETLSTKLIEFLDAKNRPIFPEDTEEAWRTLFELTDIIQSFDDSILRSSADASFNLFHWFMHDGHLHEHLQNWRVLLKTFDITESLSFFAYDGQPDCFLAGLSMKRVAVDKDFKKGFRKEEDVGALMMKKWFQCFGYHQKN